MRRPAAPPKARSPRRSDISPARPDANAKAEIAPRSIDGRCLAVPNEADHGAVVKFRRELQQKPASVHDFSLALANRARVARLSAAGEAGLRQRDSHLDQSAPKASSGTSRNSLSTFNAASEGRAGEAGRHAGGRRALRDRYTPSRASGAGRTHGVFHLIPYFQPQVDARTHEIVGVEALARWRHPTRGILTRASSSRSPRSSA